MADQLTQTQVVFSIGVLAGAARRDDDALGHVARALDDDHRQEMWRTGQALIQAVLDADEADQVLVPDRGAGGP